MKTILCENQAGNHMVKTNFSGFFGKVLFFVGLASVSCSVLASEAPDTFQAEMQQTLNSGRLMIDSAELNATQNRVSQLEAEIKTQQNSIAKLNAELKAFTDSRSDGMSFEVWTGILLACSALLLTILGIGIALLSIFGYRKIVRSSSESAQKIATKVAQETSVATANEATSTELQRLIKMGAFNAVIREAIETISYRGLQPLSELDEQEL